MGRRKKQKQKQKKRQNTHKRKGATYVAGREVLAARATKKNKHAYKKRGPTTWTKSQTIPHENKQTSTGPIESQAHGLDRRYEQNKKKKNDKRHTQTREKEKKTTQRGENATTNKHPNNNHTIENPPRRTCDRSPLLSFTRCLRRWQAGRRSRSTCVVPLFVCA
jgi:hypothetical protein